MTLVKGNKEDKELSERQRKTKDLLDKMHDSVNEEKFAYLASEVSELAFEMLDIGKGIVKDIKKRRLNSEAEISEDDEYKLNRLSRVLEACTKAVDSVNNFKNKRFSEITDAVRTEIAMENTKKEFTNINLIFPHQGSGNRSISPVLEILGEVVEEVKPEVKALPPKPKENPLEIDGKSYSKSSNAKQQRNKGKLLIG